MTTAPRWRARRRDGEDEGFTLIELLVVLLIIGVLLAIAIPTFISLTKGANDTAAQADLSTALTAATTYYVQGDESFSGIDWQAGAIAAGASDISQINVGLVFESGSSSSGPRTISLDVPSGVNGQVLIMTSFSTGRNDCWGILTLKATQSSAVFGETQPGTYFFVVHSSSPSSCTASTSLSVGSNISNSAFPAP